MFVDPALPPIVGVIDLILRKDGAGRFNAFTRAEASRSPAFFKRTSSSCTLLKPAATSTSSRAMRRSIVLMTADISLSLRSIWSKRAE